jgi:hypothetical protein
MNKVEVGDIVEVTYGGIFYKSGATGVVTGKVGTSLWVRFISGDYDRSSGSEWCIQESDIVLVEHITKKSKMRKLREGDLVTGAKHATSYTYTQGDFVGEVIELLGDTVVLVRVVRNRSDINEDRVGKTHSVLVSDLILYTKVKKDKPARYRHCGGDFFDLIGSFTSPSGRTVYEFQSVKHNTYFAVVSETDFNNYYELVKDIPPELVFISHKKGLKATVEHISPSAAYSICPALTSTSGVCFHVFWCGNIFACADTIDEAKDDCIKHYNDRNNA